MKLNTLVSLVLCIVFTACNTSNDKTTNNISEEKQKEKQALLGVWERTSYYNYGENGEVLDSFASSGTNKHIKIFTPTKVMWCRTIATDSSEWFGYGHYKLTDSILTEVLDFGSVEMSQYIKQNPEFVFHYTLEDNKYSQIQIDAEGHPLFAENYIRLE